MRNYMRHPSDIPIKIKMTHDKAQNRRMQNVRYGGLAFDSSQPIAHGTIIRIHIDNVQPQFEAEGVVRRCSQEGDHYVVGIEFTHKNDVFVARMVEQVCHIEHYKKQVKEQEGRELTTQQAASEWIAKFAADFPSP